MICHNIVGKSCPLGYSRGVVWFFLQDFQNFASSFKPAFYVSNVFQVSVRMHRVTVRILSGLG